jgi:DNA-binding transcriptional ArsR family regulator
MLLKFFSNHASSAYLRGLAEEFGESTNSIRHELNNLTKAGYLLSFEDGRMVRYRANTAHPLHGAIKNLIHRYLGFDQILESILKKIGDVRAAFVVGDYARGIDSGTIEVVVVGEVDRAYVKRLAERAKSAIDRQVKVTCVGLEEYQVTRASYAQELLLWGHP